MNETDIFQAGEVTAASITLLWDAPLNNIIEYNLHCESADKITAEFSNEIASHKVAFQLRGNSTQRRTVRGLFSQTSYNCCISTLQQSSYQCNVFQTSAPGSEGLSVASAGVLGAFLGAILTVIIGLTVAAIAVSIFIAAKRKRAIERAKIRPVLRTDSIRYNRKKTDIYANEHEDIFESPTSTQYTPSLSAPPTPPHPHKPPANTQPQCQPSATSDKSNTLEPLHSPKPQYKKKSLTAPRLKPALPLKPQIKSAMPTSYPLRRSLSQPDTRIRKVEGLYDDKEHIYDDADLTISIRARRIVSRDNVAYSQVMGDNGDQGEYEPYY